MRRLGRGDAAESGIAAELQARRRGEQVRSLPGVPGYLVRARSGVVGPAGQQRGRLRRAWGRIPPRQQKVIVFALVIGLVILLGVLGGGGGEGAGG